MSESMEPESFSPRNNLSLIVAMSENLVIGRDGDMPWHISADLKRFKRLTMGHTIIMGRKTFESIGRCLPGRTTVVVTRQRDYSIPPNGEQSFIAATLREAIERTDNDTEAFVIGGGQIYQSAIQVATRIYLTRIHTTIDDGDTFFPDIDWSDWRLTDSTKHDADKRNDFDYSFEDYVRLVKTPAGS